MSIPVPSSSAAVGRSPSGQRGVSQAVAD
jgi:hypothetical protein